jgi:hypothetical protein
MSRCATFPSTAPLAAQLRRTRGEQHGLRELHVEAITQLLDLHAACGHLALQILDQAVVGVAELRHLRLPLRELAGGERQVLLELVARHTELFDATRQRLPFGAEIFDRSDELDAFVREALVRGLEQAHAVPQQLALALELVV